MITGGCCGLRETGMCHADWECRFDPAKFILEHYVDGDLLDMREPTHHTKAAPDNLHVWGMFCVQWIMRDVVC